MESVVEDIHEFGNTCFLNSVLQADNGEVYLVIYADELLQLIGTAYVDKETLAKIPKKGLITNFIVQDEFLRCDPLPKIKVNMKAEDLLGKTEFMSYTNNFNPGSFFSFLGKASNYVYIDEEALLPNEGDDQIKYKLASYGHTSFKNLRFSQTTMTAYFHIVTPEGLKNRNIVYLNDKKYLQMNEFIVGETGINPKLPEECTSFLGEAIDSNGKVYTLYKVKMLSLYDTVKIPIDPNLVNLCCYMSLRYENAMNLLEVIIDSVTEQNNENSLSWAGGTNSHKSDFGVLFKSTGEKFSKSKCMDLVDTVMQGYIIPVMQKEDDKSEALRKVMQDLIYIGMNEEEKHLKTILANIMVLSETKEDILATAIKYKEMYRDKKFLYDKFLYWVRCYLYLNKRRITVPGRPVIHSNFIKASTVVTEGIFYGEN